MICFGSIFAACSAFLIASAARVLHAGRSISDSRSSRSVTAEQQTDFHRFMLDDVERLDRLIDHLLDAARLDQQSQEQEADEVPLADLLGRCAEVVCQHYQLPKETIQLHTQPALVHARAADLEIIFRNLFDNAIKYSGERPTINPERKTVKITNSNIPYMPAPTPPKITSPSMMLNIATPPASGDKLECMAFTEPFDATVVAVDQIKLLATPKRVSFPSIIPER